MVVPLDLFFGSAQVCPKISNGLPCSPANPNGKTGVSARPSTLIRAKSKVSSPNATTSIGCPSMQALASPMASITWWQVRRYAVAASRKQTNPVPNSRGSCAALSIRKTASRQSFSLFNALCYPELISFGGRHDQLEIDVRLAGAAGDKQIALRLKA